MPGKFVKLTKRDTHVCNTPFLMYAGGRGRFPKFAVPYGEGTIWKCDCGKMFEFKVGDDIFLSWLSGEKWFSCYWIAL